MPRKEQSSKRAFSTAQPCMSARSKRTRWKLDREKSTSDRSAPDRSASESSMSRMSKSCPACFSFSRSRSLSRVSVIISIHLLFQAASRSMSLPCRARRPDCGPAPGLLSPRWSPGRPSICRTGCRVPTHRPTTTLRSVFASFRTLACRMGLQAALPTALHFSSIPRSVLGTAPALQQTPNTSKPCSRKMAARVARWFSSSS